MNEAWNHENIHLISPWLNHTDLPQNKFWLFIWKSKHKILIICQSLNNSSSKAEFNIFKLRKDFRRINIFEYFSVFTNIFQLSAYLDLSNYMVLSLCGSFILLNKSGYHIKSKGNKTVFIYIFINKNYMFKPRGFLLSELLILLQPWLTSL